MLGQQTVFFGHQSVGWNIIEGVEQYLSANPIAGFSVAEVNDAKNVQTTGLIHTEIGENYNPQSKLQHFDRLMRDGMADKVDVAMFKFCYVDFNAQTDVTQLFNDYKTTLASLSAAYPNTTFVHVTVPLFAKGNSLKLWAKGVLGRSDEAFGNAKRHEFNELLRAEYTGNAPIFDLARLESTTTGGSTCTMTIDGQTVPCLSAELTYDGGHLSDQGKTVIAGEFLKFLSTVRQPAPAY